VTTDDVTRVALLSRHGAPEPRRRVCLSIRTAATESDVREIPKKVIDSAERIGGYLGVDERYFDANGDETHPRNAKYLVVGNYYGSAIYAVDGVVQRLRGFQ
jgi:hypothetical protein